MNQKDAWAELTSIRDLMERSSKFISLSGLSGILVGLYALIGARIAIRMVTNHEETGSVPENIEVIKWPLAGIAIAVVLLSMFTAYFLTRRKARRRGDQIWNHVSRRLLVASGIPFLTGGIFALILMCREMYSIIPAILLVFYGLALVAGSQFTFREIKWLGLAEILLGCIALAMPQYGLWIWAIGFGIFHITYGTFMHFKYER